MKKTAPKPPKVPAAPPVKGQVKAATKQYKRGSLPFANANKGG